LDSLLRVIHSAISPASGHLIELTNSSILQENLAKNDQTPRAGTRI
jgi:hypothetical protein